ncbi:MAG: substrate-binding domain-containing protein [Sulfurospirillum sp.]|nr:substrate-binding domain-containing protein [Sulfurospirillum sp.]
MNFSKKLLAACILLALSINLFAKEQKELLFYIGITMVKPIDELAKNFEKMHNCKIKILQGGSKDLYDSLKMSQVGDLYFPGSLSYRKENLKEGLLLEGVFVGFNKMALVVKKGNPKNIKASLDELTRQDLRVVLGNASSGSVGNATKKILSRYGNFQEAMLNAIFLSPDSRTLTHSLIKDDADIILNWYATAFWDNNSKLVEPLILSEKDAPKAMLVLNLLQTSKHKELVRLFMQYASSKEGQEVFYKYGFLDDEDRKNFDKISF